MKLAQRSAKTAWAFFGLWGDSSGAGTGSAWGTQKISDVAQLPNPSPCWHTYCSPGGTGTLHMKQMKAVTIDWWQQVLVGLMDWLDSCLLRGWGCMKLVPIEAGTGTKEKVKERAGVELIGRWYFKGIWQAKCIQSTPQSFILYSWPDISSMKRSCLFGPPNPSSTNCLSHRRRKGDGKWVTPLATCWTM